ncbi:O-antigen ligase family protein [Clostridium sp. DMHC 10]|uniref:O-antigen ligase family protein n=1 Tax=Clostridium sp. DMHC 10 TaxID=747377 RepID=UPI00069DFE9A|nr:O-antigen ligase family protein [Clostridium sp. DMHC 10]
MFFYSLKMLIVLVPVFLFGFFNSKVRERILNIASNSQNITRIKLWKIALKMIKDHPILGVGNGTMLQDMMNM